MSLNLTLLAQAMSFAGLLLVMIAGVAIIWMVRSRRRRAPETRLSRLDSLRASGKITADEYERQRATIISGV